MIIRRRVISLIIIMLMLTIQTAYAERDVDLFTEMSQEETVITDGQGRDYTLYPDGRIAMNGSAVKRDISSVIYYNISETVEGSELNLSDLQITDIAATEYGFVLIGLVMDNKMDEQIFGEDDLSKLVGTPYVFMFTMNWMESSMQVGVPLLLEMHDLYGYPYNTDNIKDSKTDDYRERYNWSEWLIQPRIISRGGSKSDFWILTQSKWDMGATQGATFAATENPFLVISSMKYTRSQGVMLWSGSHEMYLYPWMLEYSARQDDMPKAYREDYVFTPNATYIQEEGKDHVVVINMYDDNIGVAQQYDLSVHGRPRYEMTYWK